MILCTVARPHVRSFEAPGSIQCLCTMAMWFEIFLPGMSFVPHISKLFKLEFLAYFVLMLNLMTQITLLTNKLKVISVHLRSGLFSHFDKILLYCLTTYPKMCLDTLYLYLGLHRRQLGLSRTIYTSDVYDKHSVNDLLNMWLNTATCVHHQQMLSS